MSNHQFTCPHCRQQLDVPEQLLGPTVACPSCGGQMALPKPVDTPIPQQPSPKIPPVVLPRQESSSMASIVVNTKFLFLAWMLFFCSPRIVIDGVTYKKYWGTHRFDVAPGKHTVEIFFLYFFSKCGANSITLTVQSGGICRITYFMPPWIFSKGSISIRRH